MPLFLFFPKLHTNPALRRADGICAVIVEAANAAAVPAAARAAVEGSSAKDFVGWSTMQLATTPDPAFKPFVGQGDITLGQRNNGAGLPHLDRGGNQLLTTAS